MLDAVASRAAKDRGQQLSIMFDGEWSVAVMVELRAWLARRAAEGQDTFTFEQFRHDAISQPSSHKSWGSLPAIACRAGLIEPMNHPDGSPVMVRAESVKTHSHPVRRWRLASSFPAAAADTSPTVQEHGRAEALPFVGAASGCGSEGAYRAGQAFHRGREAG
jgi:hypothetical protein